MKNNKFTLPDLKYGYNDLEPYISEEQLTIHHKKHHQGYVNGANSILNTLNASREENSEPDIKPMLKELSFHVSGHLLHSLFWHNMKPEGQGEKEPEGALADAINERFISFERFKKEFSKTALSVEGSGWAALSYYPDSQQLYIIQIEKHNQYLIPNCYLLLVIDVWEHAYYLDYKNERGKFIENFWNIVNWEEVNMRYQSSL